MKRIVILGHLRRARLKQRAKTIIDIWIFPALVMESRLQGMSVCPCLRPGTTVDITAGTQQTRGAIRIVNVTMATGMTTDAAPTVTAIGLHGRDVDHDRRLHPAAGAVAAALLLHHRLATGVEVGAGASRLSLRSRLSCLVSRLGIRAPRRRHQRSRSSV